MTIPIPGDAPAGVVPRENGALSNILRQIQSRLSEAERKTLYSAIISAGGLTVQDGGAFRVLLDNGVQTFYVGPMTFDGVEYQAVMIRRADGTPIFFTFPIDGDPEQIAWTFRDHLNNEVLASDAQTGGLARPWIPVLLYSRISMAAGTFDYYNVTASGTERRMWEGRIPFVSQPMIEVDGVWGQASGTNTTTYRLKIWGTTVGSWVVGGGLAQDRRGPYDISGWLNDTFVPIELTAQSTGTGQVACNINACSLRQSP